MARIRALKEERGRATTLWTPKKGGRPPAHALWEITVSTGQDSTGRWRQRSERLRGTYTQAKERGADLDRHYGRRRPLEDRGLTLLEAVTVYIDHAEAMGRAAKTIDGYRSIANVLALPEARAGSLRLRRLGPADLAAYYDWLRSDRQVSLRTVSHHHALISQALNMALDNRWLDPPNPAGRARPPSPPAPEPYAPQAEDLQLFIRTWAVDPATRDKAALLLLAGVSGCRRGEACGWRWSDFDQHAGALAVRRAISVGKKGVQEKSTKTKRARRIAYSTGTIAILATQWDLYASACRDAQRVPSGDSFVFSGQLDHSTPMNPNTLTQAFRRLRGRLVEEAARTASAAANDEERAYLEERAARLGRVQLKHFRSFAATQMAGAGIDVKTASARMGHDGNVFLRHYAASIDQHDQEAGRLLESLLMPALEAG